MTWTRQQKVGKATAKSLLLLLGVLCDDEDQVKRTQNFLSEILECSQTVIKRDLALLEERGYITREKRKGGNRSLPDVITLRAGEFISRPPVDDAEEDPEPHGGSQTPRAQEPLPMGAERPTAMGAERPTAMGAERPLIKDKQKLKTKAETTTPADAGTEPIGPTGYPMTTQGLIAEWIDHCDPKPLPRVIGQMSREIKNCLGAGAEFLAVRAGVIEVEQKGLSPATLQTIVHSLQQKRAVVMQPAGNYNRNQVSTGTQRAMAAIAAGQQLQAQHDQGTTAIGHSGNRQALGPGSVGGQQDGGPGDGSGVVGNPQPFRFS